VTVTKAALPAGDYGLVRHGTLVATVEARPTQGNAPFRL
jgi:hypothetical protein